MLLEYVFTCSALFFVSKEWRARMIAYVDREVSKVVLEDTPRWKVGWLRQSARKKNRNERIGRLHDFNDEGARPEKYTLLFKVAHRGKADQVRALIWGAPALDLEHLQDGKPVLSLAAMKGHTEVVQELVRAGAALDLQDKDQCTALMWASACGYTEVVQELVRAGAALDLNSKSNRTTLMFAACYGHNEVAHELVRAGAALDLQDRSGHTALICATSKGHVAVVQELVRTLSLIHI